MSFPNARRSLRRAISTVIEPLEKRQLLASASIGSFSLDGRDQLVPVTLSGANPPALTANNFVLQNLKFADTNETHAVSVTTAGNVSTFKLNRPNTSAAVPLEDGWYNAYVRHPDLNPDEVASTFRFLNADFDGDHGISINDFNILSANFGKSRHDDGLPITFEDGDADYDGGVSINDFNILANRFGQILPDLPAQAGGVAVGNTTAGQLDVVWNADSNEPRNGFKIYRSDDGGVTFRLIHTEEDATKRTWTDTGAVEPGSNDPPHPLTLNAKYWYRVRSYTNAHGANAAVTKAWGIPTEAAPLPALTAVANPAAAAVGAPVFLHLAATGPDAAGIDKWQIQWGDDKVETITALPTSTNPGLMTWALPHAYKTAGPRTIIARAHSAAGWHTSVTAAVNITPSAIAPGGDPVVSTTPPASPTNVVGTLMAGDKITLTWEPSSGNPDNYLIFVSADGGPFDLHAIVDGTKTSYDFYAPAPGAYQFSVAAGNEAGQSGREDASFTTASGTTTTITTTVTLNATVAPTAPVGVAQSGVGYSDGVTLAWQASPDADGYVIEWSNDGYDWFAIDEADGTSYTDDYPTLGTQYYRIVAYRGNEELAYSDPSDAAEIIARAPPVAWYDDNAGTNARGTLSPFSTVHDPDEPLSVNVVPDDVDYDNSPIHIPSGGYTQPQNGEVDLDESTGEFLYTPNEGFVGTDTFTYWVTDGHDDSEPATVAIDVTNDVPVANSATYDYGASDAYRAATVDGRYDLLIRSQGLSASDGDNDSLKFEIVDQPRTGQVTINEDTGALTYEPGPGFLGVDSFTYLATDEVSDSAPAVITIRALSDESALAAAYWNSEGLPGVWNWDAPINNTIYEFFQSYILPEDIDPQTLSVSVIGAPSKGSIDRWLADPWNPGWGYEEDDVSAKVLYFRYKPPGSIAPEDTEPVTATVSFSNGAVTSKPSEYVVLNGSPRPGNMGPARFGAHVAAPTYISSLATYNDPLQVTQNAEHGTVTKETLPNGSFRLVYTPKYDPSEPISESNRPYSGWDFFSYTVTTPSGWESEQWVQMNVGGDVAPPPQKTFYQAPGLVSSFDGTLADLSSRLENVQQQKTAVEEALATQGQNWLDLALADDDDEDAYLALIGRVGSGQEPVQTAYDQYLESFKQLNADAAAYQSTWQATADQYVDATAYSATLSGIQALPIDIGNLRAGKEVLDKIGQAFSDFGDGAGLQANLAGQVFTVADSSHKVLETVEFGAGLLSGGTITVASVTTKAGLKALAKTIAKNYADDVVANTTGVSPAMLKQIATKAIQGAAVLKVAKGKLKPGPRLSAQASFNQTQKYGGDRARHILRDNMDLTHGPANGRKAHHLVPLNLKDDHHYGNIMRRGVNGGFDINGVKNGKYLDKDDHIGSHPRYDSAVKDLIDLWYKRGMSDSDCAKMLEQVASVARGWKPMEL